MQLYVPVTRRSTIGDRAFPVAAARAWNSKFTVVCHHRRHCRLSTIFEDVLVCILVLMALLTLFLGSRALSFSGPLLSLSVEFCLCVCVCVGSRALSFKRPLLSVDVDVCGSVCLSVCLSATLRSNISETKGDRG